MTFTHEITLSFNVNLVDPDKRGDVIRKLDQNIVETLKECIDGSCIMESIDEDHAELTSIDWGRPRPPRPMLGTSVEPMPPSKKPNLVEEPGTSPHVVLVTVDAMRPEDRPHRPLEDKRRTKILPSTKIRKGYLVVPDRSKIVNFDPLKREHGTHLTFDISKATTFISCGEAERAIDTLNKHHCGDYIDYQGTPSIRDGFIKGAVPVIPFSPFISREPVTLTQLPGPQLTVDVDEFKELFEEAMSAINSRNLADYDDVAEVLFAKMTKDPTDICDQVKADVPDLDLAEVCEAEPMTQTLSPLSARLKEAKEAFQAELAKYPQSEAVTTTDYKLGRFLTEEIVFDEQEVPDLDAIFANSTTGFHEFMSKHEGYKVISGEMHIEKVAFMVSLFFWADVIKEPKDG